MVHQLDAGTERRLKELRVGGRNAIPLQSMEVSREVARRIDSRELSETVGLGLVNLRTELELPEHLEGPPLIVVIEANELYEGCVSVFRWSDDGFDEPLAMADLDDVAGPRRVARDRVGREQRLRRSGLRCSVRLEQSRGQNGSGAAGLIEVVRSARDLELVAAEKSEKLTKAKRSGVQQRIDLGILRFVRRHRDGECTSKLEESRLRERLEDRAGGRDGHGSRG
jgi:hypothetical protein